MAKTSQFCRAVSKPEVSNLQRASWIWPTKRSEPEWRIGGMEPLLSTVQPAALQHLRPYCRAVGYLWPRRVQAAGCWWARELRGRDFQPIAMASKRLPTPNLSGWYPFLWQYGGHYKTIFCVQVKVISNHSRNIPKCSNQSNTAN